MSTDYDVIIVGAGGAGLAAALMAHDAGASVLLVESEEIVGGSSRLSGGIIYAAHTSVQRALGIEDSVDAAYDYYMTLNQWRLEPSLVRRLCEGGEAAIDWLISLGVEFKPQELYASGVESVPRGHKPTGSGAAIVEALDQARKARGIDVALKTRVTGLITEDGAVVGIRAGDQELRAGAVILTTGGFGRNPAFLAEFYPEAHSAGNWIWYIGAEGARGDGIRLGKAIGAGMIGHNRGLLLVTPGLFKGQLEMVPGWVVYVNRLGRRFIDESAPYAVMSGAVREQGGVAWAILDEETRQWAEPGKAPHSWTADVIEQMAGVQRVESADSIEELGRKAGIETEALQTTIEKYNAAAKDGEDPYFFKAPSLLRPVRKPPFYAARGAPRDRRADRLRPPHRPRRARPRRGRAPDPRPLRRRRSDRRRARRPLHRRRQFVRELHGLRPHRRHERREGRCGPLSVCR